MAKNELSFLPEDYVERRKEQRTNLICLTLFILVLGGVVGAWFVTSRDRAEIRRQQEQVNTAYADAARRLEQLQKLEKQKQQMLRKAQTTANLVEPVPRTFLLADLINRMPSTLSLFSCSLHSKVIKPPVIHVKKTAMSKAKKGKDEKKEQEEPPPPRTLVSLVLTGVAPTDVQVAQYMSALSRSPLLSDVNLVFSEETKLEDQTMRRFEIQMMLREQADVRMLQPDAIPRKLKSDPLADNPAIAAPLPAGIDGALNAAGLGLFRDRDKEN